MVTAYLKAKTGTAFQLYQEWQSLSDEERGLWPMDGIFLTAVIDKAITIARI